MPASTLPRASRLAPFQVLVLGTGSHVGKSLVATALCRLLADRGFYDKGMNLIDRADRSLSSLEEITSRLQRGEGTAGKLLSDKELYDKLNRMVDDLDLLVRDIKENPKRYLKFSLF